MKKVLMAFALLIVLFLSGCDVWDSNFILDKDLPQRYEEKEAEYYECVGKGGYYWSNEEQTCKQMEETKGCITLNSWERITTTTLPKRYKHITDNFYNKSISIRFWCTESLYKDSGKTCEEKCESVSSNEPLTCKFSHYEIKAMKEPITLCWN